MPGSPKRHHFVPRLLFRRFSYFPADRNPPLFRLDVKSGEISEVRANSESVVKYFNQLEEEYDLASDPVSKSWVEEQIAVIESDAKKAIDSVVAGTFGNDDDPWPLAAFIWLQYVRTPLIRSWRKTAYEFTMTSELVNAVGNPAIFKRAMASLPSELLPDDLEEFRREYFEGLVSGRIQVQASRDHEVLLQLMDMDVFPVRIANEMSWAGIRAPFGSRFVLGDHPVSIYDLNARPDSLIAWFSSSSVEAAIPLDPDFCIMMRPGKNTYHEVTVSESWVTEINLRTYAWAHWSVYGQTEEDLLNIRYLASELPDAVEARKPRPPIFLSSIYRQGHPGISQVISQRPSKKGKRGRSNE